MCDTLSSILALVDLFTLVVCVKTTNYRGSHEEIVVVVVVVVVAAAVVVMVLAVVVVKSA